MIDSCKHVFIFSVPEGEKPQTCEYLQRVYEIVWNVGAYDTLEELFMGSEDLVRGQDLYEKLLQVLSIEKQDLLRKMELVTFLTDNEQWVMESYRKVLGKTDQDFQNFENLVDKSFSGIGASSDVVNCYDYPSCWQAFRTFFRYGHFFAGQRKGLLEIFHLQANSVDGIKEQSHRIERLTHNSLCALPAGFFSVQRRLVDKPKQFRWQCRRAQIHSRVLENVDRGYDWGFHFPTGRSSFDDQIPTIHQCP